MTIFSLTTEIVANSHRYTLHVDSDTSVSRLAQYLSQQEAYINAGTIEVARILQPDQRLQDIDFQVGQRLVLFSQPSEPAALPAPLMPGDKVLRLYGGQAEFNSRGSKTLRLGKPDQATNFVPDVDLRNFVTPKNHGFISRNCLRLEFDERNKIWYAERRGQTRVKIDEYEVTAQPMLLDNNCVLRFFKANEDPDNDVPVGEVNVAVETVQSQHDIIYLREGAQTVNLHVGAEKESLKLRLSNNVQMGKIIDQLGAHLKLSLEQGYRLCLIQIVSPNRTVESLRLDRDQFLYVPRRLRYAQNLLRLKDVHHRKIYELSAGSSDDEKIIGRRPEAERVDAALDVDLYEVVLPDETDRDCFKRISRRQAYAFYKAADNTWWLRLSERTSASVFVNNSRLTGSTPVQLTTGDVLSFGPDVNRYLARLEVEITSQGAQE